MSPRIKNYYRAVLPHYEVDAGTYFITIRCAGSLPRTVLAELEQIRQILDNCQYDSETWREQHRRMFLTMEKYLDQGVGFCPFRDSKCAQLLVYEFQYLRENGWNVTNYVIMPNHLHLLADVNKDSVDMKTVWTSWKGMTARKCNLLLKRQGPFWQRDWFDRWIRDKSGTEKAVEYISNNPVKAGIVEKREEYPWMR